MSLDRLISFHGIASGLPTLPRRVQLVKPETGWQGFVDKYVKPLRDLGISRFLLWMPFGQETGDNDGVRSQWVHGFECKSRVRFDQYLQAQKASLPWLTTGFVEAIRPLTLEGCQVIAYCGTLAGAPEYERRRWDRAQWVGECLEPFIDANCDLAFDSCILAPKGHYVANVVEELLADSDARIYAESMPKQSAPHWAEGDVFSVEEQYQAAYNQNNRAILVDPKDIKGELVRSVTSSFPKDQTWTSYYRVKVPEVLADGHSACIHVKAFLEGGGKIEELIS